MWSNEIRDNLYKELEVQLDNKKFFDAKAYYASNKTDTKVDEKENTSNLVYAKKNTLNNDFDYENTVRGMSFSNKINNERDFNNNLTNENIKIYSISELLAQNVAMRIEIPYNVKSNNSLALVKKFDWRDILFSDVKTALEMIKEKVNIKHLNIK